MINPCVGSNGVLTIRSPCFPAAFRCRASQKTVVVTPPASGTPRRGPCCDGLPFHARPENARRPPGLQRGPTPNRSAPRFLSVSLPRSLVNQLCFQLIERRRRCLTCRLFRQ